MCISGICKEKPTLKKKAPEEWVSWIGIGLQGEVRYRVVRFPNALRNKTLPEAQRTQGSGYRVLPFRKWTCSCKTQDGGAKLPSHKYGQVKFGNTIHHFDKYRQEMCAAAVIISRSWVDAQPECITNSVSQTLLPSEIWFAKHWEIHMMCGVKKYCCKTQDLLSSRAAAARWRGGDGCSLPAAHQNGRSTISNISGNSLDLPIHVLRVVWRSVMQSCQWFAPPSCARLDCRHCTVGQV